MAQSFIQELGHTARSLLQAYRDYRLLRGKSPRTKPDPTFAFLVHPRTDDFVGTDVYGRNDIYRPFPAFRHLFKVMPRFMAEWIILKFAMWVVPTILSKIKVRVGDATVGGFLITTVRTPSQLLGRGSKTTRPHLQDVFELANRMGVLRVGLGALLPAMTGYARNFAIAKPDERAAVSTGHAYTGYCIAEYVRTLANARHAHAGRITLAIAGAAGSTGKSLLRVLKKTWKGPIAIDLILVDLAVKEVPLQALLQEARNSNVFASVKVSTDLTSLRQADYVAVVTNARGAIITPEHLTPGTVVIDDSQPRNTSPALVAHGCVVVDVLARVPGLDVGFDFGFKTSDTSITFTCLAETVLATVAQVPDDLAVGEVTDQVVDRTLKMVEKGRDLGLVGELPFFSFGEELPKEKQEELLTPVFRPLAPAAE